VLSDLAVRAGEGWADRRPAADAASADAIVVLSEGRILAPGDAAISEWRDSDRFFGGVELYRAGKAPRLVFTGGAVPWQPKAPSDGAVMRETARTMGVPDSAVVTTGPVANTEEEAHAVAQLLGVRAGANTVPRRHILLVTSAYHMRRARLLFEGAGMDVTTFPVDFQLSATEGWHLWNLLPSVSALQRTEMIWRESYGTLFYRLKATLRPTRA
jgi:uncharacterized SAM-binding protein YcdF (DUF218 family)